MNHEIAENVRSDCWPQCRGELQPVRGERVLECGKCGATYPRRETVPAPREVGEDGEF